MKHVNGAKTQKLLAGFIGHCEGERLQVGTIDIATAVDKLELSSENSRGCLDIACQVTVACVKIWGGSTDDELTSGCPNIGQSPRKS